MRETLAAFLATGHLLAPPLYPRHRPDGLVHLRGGSGGGDSATRVEARL